MVEQVSELEDTKAILQIWLWYEKDQGYVRNT